MIKRFTYKELTLVLGIVVALLVIFTLWLRQPSGTFSDRLKLPTHAGILNR
jgi:ABC-type transporter Mla subunit MlaD